MCGQYKRFVNRPWDISRGNVNLEASALITEEGLGDLEVFAFRGLMIDGSPHVFILMK
jgi:hypothetical protein